MTHFPCPKCDGQGEQAPYNDIHPNGGFKNYWECPKCKTTFATRHYLLGETIVVGEDYKPGIIEAGATFVAKGKTD